MSTDPPNPPATDVEPEDEVAGDAITQRANPLANAGADSAAGDDEFDRAASIARREAEQLRATIVALRDRLEADALAHESQTRDLIAQGVKERGLVEAAVVSLRDALERANVDGDLARQREKDHAAAEIQQLRDTVRALRDELAAQAEAGREALDQARREAEHARAELEATVRALRSSLESRGGMEESS